MNPKLLVIAASLLLIVPAALAGAPRTEAAPYAPGVAVCQEHVAWWGHGTTCFDLDGSESSVDLVIDDHSGLAVHGTALFRDGSGTLGMVAVCGSAEDLAVPAGAVELTVYLDPYWSTIHPLEEGCGTGSLATFGTVTAHFT